MMLLWRRVVVVVVAKYNLFGTGAVVCVVEAWYRLFLETTNPVVGLMIVVTVSREAVIPKRESVRNIHNPIAAKRRLESEIQKIALPKSIKFNLPVLLSKVR
jgi:hypothetical protein